MDRVPCPLHKHFLVRFQVSLSVGGFAIEGSECPVIQSPSCHSGADARAVSWISIAHSHSPSGGNGELGQWNPMP